MNKFCVFAKNKQSYFIKRLIEEVGDKVKVFDPWSDSDLPPAQWYLPRTTGVYHSDLDLLMLSSLAPSQLVNSLPVLKRFRSKITQYQWMDGENISQLPWINLKGIDSLTAEKFMRLYPEVVVKPHCGQGGWGVMALKQESYKSWAKKHDQNYLMQKLFKGTEYRIFFIKDSLRIVLKRKAMSGIAANFQNEGSAELAQLPSQFDSQVEELILKSGAHYGAIDFMVDEFAGYFLELNSVPGIEQLEKISHTNIIQKLVGSLT